MLTLATAGVIDSSSTSSLDDSEDVAPSIPVITAPEYPEPKPMPQIIKIIRIPPSIYNPLMPMTRIIHVIQPAKPPSVYNSKFFQEPPKMIRMLRIQRPAPSMRIIKFIDNNNLW